MVTLTTRMSSSDLLENRAGPPTVFKEKVNSKDHSASQKSKKRLITTIFLHDSGEAVFVLLLSSQRLPSDTPAYLTSFRLCSEHSSRRRDLCITVLWIKPSPNCLVRIVLHIFHMFFFFFLTPGNRVLVTQEAIISLDLQKFILFGEFWIKSDEKMSSHLIINRSRIIQFLRKNDTRYWILTWSLNTKWATITYQAQNQMIVIQKKKRILF